MYQQAGATTLTEDKRHKIDIPVHEIMPAHEAVQQAMGMPPGSDLPARYQALFEAAFETFRVFAAPCGIHGSVSKEDFSTIYSGEGRNSSETPLEHIYPRAEGLELFVLTLGEEVSLRIDDLFTDNEAATGYVLDLIASEAAINAVRWLGQRMFRTDARSVAPFLGYSPGYCGWHISGQWALFDRLAPGLIDVRLTPSCLMAPLKSVSGVLVRGARDIHRFRNVFPFCESCRDKNCRGRISSLAAARAGPCPGASRAAGP